MVEFTRVEFKDGVEIKDKLKSESNIDNLKQASQLCNFVCFLKTFSKALKHYLITSMQLKIKLKTKSL